MSFGAQSRDASNHYNHVMLRTISVLYDRASRARNNQTSRRPRAMLLEFFFGKKEGTHEGALVMHLRRDES